MKNIKKAKQQTPDRTADAPVPGNLVSKQRPHAAPPAPARRPFYRRKIFLWPAGIIIALVLTAVLAFRVSPWPGALVIRAVFNRGGHKTLAALQAALPRYPVTKLADLSYHAGDRHAKLDVYMPDSVQREDTRLPVVVWTHGGAWLSGDKKDAGPYFARLANQGYIVVAPNYTLAPARTYPYAVRELNDAYDYLQANAARLHADMGRVVLAGDSAGAQLSAQLAALITNPAYAAQVGVRPQLQPSQLSGVVLFCGIYQMQGLTEPDTALPKIIGWGDDVAVWAYSGTRDFGSARIRQMSPYYYATANFPPAFISGGNADPLTAAQSQPFAAKLQSLGVPVSTLFYPANHRPPLPHEYQFTMNADGERAFAQMTQFLQARTAR